MEASFFSKAFSQSECRIKITSLLLSKSECRNLGHDLTQKTQTNKMVEARHNADKHYLFINISRNVSTGRAQLIQSHSSARFCFELSGNSN